MAEQFTGTPGRYVELEDTVSGFEAILNGEADDIPENAFSYVGSIDEAFDKSKDVKSDSSNDKSKKNDEAANEDSKQTQEPETEEAEVADTSVEENSEQE